MDNDVIKTMIQQSLWEMYVKTGIEEYKKLYENWYNSYENIKINGLK